MINLKSFYLIIAAGIAGQLFADEQIPTRNILTQRRFAVIVPNFNTKPWYRKTLDALFNQEYDNFYILFIDDGDDGVGYLAQSYAKERGHAHRFILIKNEWRHYKVLNLYNVIHQYIDDDHIIAINDGDDWYASNQVLAYLNDKYQREGCWLTWGGFIRHPENRIAHQFQVPENVIQENSFRQNCHLCLGAALRSFEAWLYKQIPLEEFFFNGMLFRTTGDMAKMFPMYEMAGPHIWLNDEILYVCNTRNPFSDHRIAAQLQAQAMKYILQRPPLTRLQDRVPASSRVVMNERAQVMIFADEQTTPEMISGITEHYTEIGAVTIIADNPNAELLNAPFVYPTNFIQGTDIPQHIKNLVESTDFNYFFFVIADQHTPMSSALNLNEYIQILETTKAYAFYLKPNENSDKKFVGEILFDRYLAWQFAFNKKNHYGNAHILHNVLHRKKDVIALLNQITATNTAQFIEQWQQLPRSNPTAIGVGITV